MFAHHPVQRGEGGTRIGPDLGGQQRCCALHPGHVRITFGTGAGEHCACGGESFDQLTLFLLECQLGALHLDDFMQPFGLGERGRDAGWRSRGSEGTTLVATRRIKIVLDPCQPLGHIDLPIRAHWQTFCHQLRDTALGQANPCGKGRLGFGGVEFSQFRPQTLAGSCAALPHIRIGPKGTAAFPVFPD